MGRIRTVKPELFKHEELYDLEKETGLPIRVAFIGLFTCCDREGRFKWKPRTLKIDVLPHDEVDFSRVLDALWSRGFVQKYVIDTQEFGVIPTFAKHQVINNRESDSDLPEPDENSYVSMVSTREPRVNDATGTPTQWKGRERKGKEGNGKGKEGKESANALVDQKQVDPSADPVSVIFAYWQKHMNSPRSALDDKRKKLIEKALKSYSPADICKAIRGCAKTPFYMGDNDRKMKYNGLGLILRSAEYVDKFIELDNQQATGTETLEERNARIMREVMKDIDPNTDDPDIIDMEPT